MVADIHLRAFPKSALTKLGKEAVRRYYEWQLTGPHDCLAIGAFDERGCMLGFCFGGVFRGALTGFVKKNKHFLILEVLKRPWLVFTNSIFRDRLRLGIRISRKLPAQKNLRKVVSFGNFGILAIAVDPDVQSSGIGRQLMDFSETYALANGFKKMQLSVALDNNQAIRFYEHNGWKKECNDEVWNGFMTKNLV